MRSLPVITAAALTLVAASAQAKRLVPYSGPPSSVTTRSLVPHLVGDENYYEQYNFEASLDEDVDFYLRMRIANLGPGDGRMEVTVRTRDPETHARVKYFDKLDRDSWNYAKGRFSITAGKTRVSGDPSRIRVQGSGGGFSFDLVFTAQAKGWRPGKGRVLLGDDGYYATSIVFPRAKVEGTVTVKGKVHHLSGWGFATHSHSNVAPYEVARRWVQFDSHDNEYAIYLRYFMPAEGYPARPVAFLLVTFEDRVVFQGYQVKVRAEKTKVDRKTDAKYKMPGRIVVDAVAPGQKVHLVLEGTKMYHRSAMLEEAGMVERVVIKRFAEPVDYNYRCKYSLTIDNEGHPPVTVTGEATYSVNYLNP